MNEKNLRSPHEKVGGIVYFGRMLDKIHLHMAGQLPADYQPNLGGGFDARCVSFLGIEYPGLVERAAAGGTDEEILEWAFRGGRKPSEEEIEIWNEFMRKRGWNDEAAERLRTRKLENGLADREDIQTFFDFIDLDEGRDPKRRSSGAGS